MVGRAEGMWRERCSGTAWHGDAGRSSEGFVVGEEARATGKSQARKGLWVMGRPCHKVYFLAVEGCDQIHQVLLSGGQHEGWIGGARDRGRKST